MSRTAEDWAGILAECGVTPANVEIWAPAFADQIHDETFSAGDADVVPFVAQTLVETQKLSHLQENLNYSPERLCAVWPSRFPDVADAFMYAHNPEALANKVYGGRMGNDEPGDGYKYRGRGIPMVTGKAGYAALAEVMGIDLVGQPELLEQPAIALAAGIHWWEQRVPDSILGDTQRVSERVNGGDVGLKDRIAMTHLVQGVLA